MWFVKLLCYVYLYSIISNGFLAHKNSQHEHSVCIKCTAPELYGNTWNRALDELDPFVVKCHVEVRLCHYPALTFGCVQRTSAENGLDEQPKADQTDSKDEPSFWDEKKEEDDSPGFWDEKKDEDGAGKEEKAEDDSPGFWDQKEGSPEKEVKKEENDSPGFWDQKEESPAKEVKKEENESPGFWDEQESNDQREEPTEEDAKSSENVEVEPAKPVEEEAGSEEEEDEDEDEDEIPDIAELKDVAQRLVCLS